MLILKKGGRILHFETVLIDAFNRYVYLYASLKHIFEPCWPEVYYIEYSIVYSILYIVCTVLELTA